MIFVLYEYWKNEFHCESFLYHECANIQQAQYFIRELHSSEDPKGKWFKYRNIRIIEGNQNVIDHPFRGDNC